MLMIIKIKIQLKYNNNLKPKIKIIKNYINVLLGVYDIYVRLTTIELEFYCFFYKCTFVLHVTNMKDDGQEPLIQMQQKNGEQLNKWVNGIIIHY